MPSGPCAVRVPTGLATLTPIPRLSGGGASCTSIDLRSGNPGEANKVLLSHACILARGRTLTGFSFCYSYVVGYSGIEGDPGPTFELQLLDEDEPGSTLHPAKQPSTAKETSMVGCPCCQPGGSQPFARVDVCEECAANGAGATIATPYGPNEHGDVQVLYRSPEAGTRPSWDASTGGSPTNYSATVHVAQSCAIGPLRSDTVSLQLAFRNGKRNMHLQGGDWLAGGEACNFQLQLFFDGAQPPESGSAHS